MVHVEQIINPHLDPSGKISVVELIHAGWEPYDLRDLAHVSLVGPGFYIQILHNIP